jgi:prohibitin 2
MVEKIFDRMGKLGGLFLLGGVIGTRFIFVVDGGERALKMNAFKGLSPKIYGEGMHFRWPFIESVKRFEIRT